ncbi:hypothetical protein HG536_0B04720 [Torulaspora globosa]|uniref:Vps72/YL1 C-terminal domain-containing protein n=1 Tax=Torulaspora globosa TaxID=48254 RepID=A0A7G3ZDM2_9SACH|nr:uncharacterized protein HG536_0B04720 [Torulaspora globosa]QLL31608.1 hypothetical protein HG536_0B04720 [Torulaspora globosa]
MSNGGGNDRLEFLRRVAGENVIPVPSRFKKHGYRKPSRRHKSARQLIADESKRISLLLQEEGGGVKRVPKVTYFNVNGPPSMRPTKKYCDITGLAGLYRSPVNNLRYHNAEIYQLVVKPMAPGVDQEYLKLRGDHFVLK